MKRYSIFILAALALVACNKEQSAVVDQPEADQTPVSFGAYVYRPTTKAGFFNSNLGIDVLKDSAHDKGAGGFGVFAYYTNADNYDQTFTPNFMYNQQILHSDNTLGWRYSPVKYWPNEFGSNAYSDDADKISFFAYAPYVSVNVSSGKVNGTGEDPYFACDNGRITEGIVGMKRNNATGDPMIQYKVSAYTDHQVDLLWGVVGSDASDLVWSKKNGTTQSLDEGYPFLNIEHPSLTSSNTSLAGQEVKFTFLHSLASLNVTVDTKANVNGSTPAAPNANTRVYIRSVTFEGFDTKGALNLNNDKVVPAGKALWYNFDCSNELNNGAEFTIYDGRRDGKEGITAATKEYIGINPKFIQDDVWETATNLGVDATPSNLFCELHDTDPAAISYASPGATVPILVIPNSDPLKVTIEYDVLTKDPELAGIVNDGVTAGSVVKNVITRYITQGATSHGSVSNPDDQAIILQNGKTYTIALHLGLNSVEFDASVHAWDGTMINGGADLPQNN